MKWINLLKIFPFAALVIVYDLVQSLEIKSIVFAVILALAILEVYNGQTN